MQFVAVPPVECVLRIGKKPSSMWCAVLCVSKHTRNSFPSRMAGNNTSNLAHAKSNSY